MFSEDQRKALEKMFQKQKYISKTDRRKLAVSLGLKESQVPMRREMPPIPSFSRSVMKFVLLARMSCASCGTVPRSVLKCLV